MALPIDLNVKIIIKEESEYIHPVVAKIIDNYINNPTDKLVFHNVNIPMIPKIIASFDMVEHMTITNCGLTSLINLPKNVKTLNITSNNLHRLDASEVNQSLIELIATKNNIDEVDIDNKNLEILNLENNPLKQIKQFPPNLTYLNVSNSSFNQDNILNSLSKLKIFNGDKCNLITLDNLPDSLLDVSLSNLTIYGKNINHNNKIGFVSKLPTNIQKLNCQLCNISKFGFDKFPKSLVDLNLCDNNITTLPILSDNMKYVNVSKNHLTTIAKLPEYIQRFECTYNKDLVFTPEQYTQIKNLRIIGCIFISENDLSAIDVANTISNNPNLIKSSESNIIVNFIDRRSNRNTETNTNDANHVNHVIVGHSKPIEPKYPEFIRTRMRGDGFISRKKQSRMIAHQFIFKV
jgi:hypothetical protein